MQLTNIETLDHLLKHITNLKVYTCSALELNSDYCSRVHKTGNFLHSL